MFHRSGLLASDVPTTPSKSLPSKFTVGLIQMAVAEDPAVNLQRAVERIHEAAGSGAQVICLPELFRSPYFCQQEDTRFFDLAEPIPGPTTERLTALARS